MNNVASTCDECFNKDFFRSLTCYRSLAKVKMKRTVKELEAVPPDRDVSTTPDLHHRWSSAIRHLLSRPLAPQDVAVDGECQARHLWTARQPLLSKTAAERGTVSSPSRADTIQPP